MEHQADVKNSLRTLCDSGVGVRRGRREWDTEYLKWRLSTSQFFPRMVLMLSLHMLIALRETELM